MLMNNKRSYNINKGLTNIVTEEGFNKEFECEDKPYNVFEENFKDMMASWVGEKSQSDLDKKDK
jgi:hypothetical protein